MPDSIPTGTLEKFTTFGDLLRFLRRRAGITQVELSIAVGYSDPQISRLEQNLRLPDIPTIEARFIAPLCLEDEPKAAARLIELAATVRREDAPSPGLCPYKGLDYFDEADADIFVGREALSEKLLQRVLNLTAEEEASHNRFFAIVGASGSGKSSLVRAGLVTALHWNKASANWVVQVLTPTAHPLESLASTLTRANGSIAATAKLMDDLVIERRTLSLYIRREIKTSPGSYFLLVIDQFEELFALCHVEAERSAFIDNLLTAAADVDGKVIIVITLRADFYAYCAGYIELRQALAKHQEYIGGMSDEEMRRAIEEPAQRGRWEFEPGLVDLILHDVGHEPGALPLLSHALFETWQRRQGRTLTLSGYASAGGVRGAIAETAEAVFSDKFNREQQLIARRIFIRLTELGDENTWGDTRRRATFNELILKPQETDVTLAVLKALADARLVTTSENYVEVAHEALIREWPTLRGWLEENRDGLRLHRHLTEAAQDWFASGHEPDLLFRGARLAQVQEWAAAHADDMNLQEHEFLEVSVAATESVAAEREAQHQRELEAAQKLADTERQRAEEGVLYTQRLRRRSIITSVIGALAVLLAVLAIFAWMSSVSQTARIRSVSLASAAQLANQSGQGDLALALAMEGVKINPPPVEAVNALRVIASSPGTRKVLSGHSHEVRAAAFSPDAKIAFSGSCAHLDDKQHCKLGELILWDISSSKELKRWNAHSAWVTAVAISSDGQTLVSGGGDGSLILWDRGGNQIRQLVGHTDSVNDLNAMANSNNLLSGSEDGYLILWDMNTGYVLQRFALTSPIEAISAARDVSLAVSAHKDGSLKLWELNNRQPIQNFPLQGGGIESVALAPDGWWILITTSDTPGYYLRMINSLDGKLLHQLMFACAPGDLALSPDLSYALITCSSSIIKMDLKNWILQNSFSGCSEVFNTISINQDGNLGLSTSKDGNLCLWNLSEELTSHIETINADILAAIDISSDGKYILMNDTEKDSWTRPALWDIAQRKVTRTFDSAWKSISPGGVKVSPDRRFVAAVGMTSIGITAGTYKMIGVTLWELETGKTLYTYSLNMANAGTVAFSPDSKYLLVGTQGQDNKSGQLFLLDTETFKSVFQFDSHEDVSSIAFSSDGTHAITGSSFLGRVILWDVKTGKEIRRFPYADYGPVLSVAFGPNDLTILGSGVGELYLWDEATGKLIRNYTGLTTSPWSVAISPDGKYVISGTMNGEMILWDYNTGEELHRENFNQGIISVLFSPDGKTAFAASIEGKLIELQISEKPLNELLDWIKANRYVRVLTCAEKLQYHIVTQCIHR